MRALSTPAREQRREEQGRIEQLDPFVAQHVGDGGDERIGVARLEPGQDGNEGEVGNDAGENLDVTHLAGHHRLGCSRGLEQLDALAKLAEGHPMQRRPGRAGGLLQFGEGLFLDGDDGDLVAEVTSALQCEEGKLAVAGDEADARH